MRDKLLTDRKIPNFGKTEDLPVEPRLHQTVLIRAGKTNIRVLYMRFTIHCWQNLIFHEKMAKVTVEKQFKMYRVQKYGGKI
jgi:hypothetical protein